MRTTIDRRQLVLGLMGLLICAPASAADKTLGRQLEQRIDQLDDPDPKVRAEAACVVGRMGTQSRRAGTALANALTLEVRSTIPGRRGYSCECPKRPEDSAAWLEWSRACRDLLTGSGGDPIPWALRKVGGTKLGVRAVMSMIRAEPLLRFDHGETAELLAKLGPEAISELEKAIEDPDAVVRYIAIWALPSIDPPTKPAEKALQRAVREQTDTTQQQAVLALEELREAWTLARKRERLVRELRLLSQPRSH
jgi:HEAT repeat protein